jgi:hypothetical protein
MTQRHMSILPRWMHRLYAAVGGYFWSPCASCGRMMGGHEWRDRGPYSGSLPCPADGVRRFVALCPACTREGRGGSRWVLWLIVGGPYGVRRVEEPR